MCKLLIINTLPVLQVIVISCYAIWAAAHHRNRIEIIKHNLCTCIKGKGKVIVIILHGDRGTCV